MDHYNEVNKKDLDACSIIVITGSDSWIYSLCGTEIKQLDKISILREKSHKKGGQSSSRFQANRECQMRDYGNLVRDKLIKSKGDTNVIFVISNAGLGKQFIPESAGVHHINMDLSSWSVASICSAVRPVLDEVIRNKDNTKIKGILDSFALNPENWIVGAAEVAEYTQMYPWAIKEIYVHERLLPFANAYVAIDLAIVNVTIVSGNDENAHIFLSGYGGIMANVRDIKLN